MKTYTKKIINKVGVELFFYIIPDTKRKGLYKIQHTSSLDAHKRIWSDLYGKCNQEYIANCLKNEEWEAV